MKILVIGSGAREHALCWKIAQSPLCSSLFCAPGNDGIAQLAQCVPSVGAEDIPGILDWADVHKPDLVVIGPDGALALGLVDSLEARGIKAFGPTRAAAKLEWSKAFMKDLCRQNNIPTAAYGRFTDLCDAKKFINIMCPPMVVKADGLALGKGVIICHKHLEAINAAENMLTGRLFGEAGTEIVIEEFLQGFEASYFAYVDGRHVVPIGAAQDHKRVGEGDTGPNTGGMGAISPVPGFTPEVEKQVLSDILQPLANALADAGTPYSGVVFAGLMIHNGKPVVIEFNARWGDPETQSLMPLLEDDIVPYFMAVAEHKLNGLGRPKLSQKASFGVAIAAKGYPDKYEKRTSVRLPTHTPENIHVFHAGTIKEGDHWLNSGGRTLSIVAVANTMAQAKADAYAFIDQIDWPQGYYRRDIGWRAFQ